MKDFQSVSRGSFSESMKQYDVLGHNVDEDIFITYFACDYETCKGACCWQKLEGVTEGCPVTSTEAKLIREHKYELADKIKIEEEHIIASTNPLYEYEGETCVRLTKDERCVYSDSSGCICKQLFGKAPKSCSLYPLGIDENGLHLYHDFDMYCKSSYTKGLNENIFLIDFLKDAIIRLYGDDFYSELKRIQNDIITRQK